MGAIEGTGMINSLLIMYRIRDSEIPVKRPEIDEIDLEGRIRIDFGNSNGIRMKIIGAIGYFNSNEFFEAALSFETAKEGVYKGKSVHEYKLEKIVILAELCALSYEKANELNQAQKRKSNPKEDLAWTYSRLAEAYVGLIRQRGELDKSLSILHQRIHTIVEKAIGLFEDIGINPFIDHRTKNLYKKLAPYIQN